MNRDDFKILKDDFIFFDNCATTLKPNIVVDETVKYYTHELDDSLNLYY